MIQFATYLDSGYLSRFIPMLESFNRPHQGLLDYQVNVLCMDAECHEILDMLSLPNVRLCRLETLFKRDTDLAEKRLERSKYEFFFTCTAAWCAFLLHEHSDDPVIYLDADLYFYRSIQPVLDEIGDASVGIIPHNFSPDWQHCVNHGVYNVGLVFFRNDAIGRACANDWREKCLDWCYDRVEGERYADQKYLDAWPERFEKVCVIQHKGANLAWWNIGQYGFSIKGGQVFVDGFPAIFYHFANFSHPAYGLIDTRFMVAKGQWLPYGVVKRLHFPYIRDYLNACDRVMRLMVQIGRNDVEIDGNTRLLASEGKDSLSLAFTVRRVLEGRYIGVFKNVVFYVNSVVCRKSVAWVCRRRHVHA